MIQCDVQGERYYQWYHGDCVDITSEKGSKMERDNEHFVRPVCDKATSILRT